LKKSKNTIENTIKNTILLSSTIIIIVVVGVIAWVLIKTEYNNFKTHIKNFRNTLVQREEFYIKTTAQNLKNDIEFEKTSILNNEKQRVKNQSIIAYNLAYFLHEKNKDKNKKEQIKLIKESLRKISKKENDINYFILNKEGTFILNTQDYKDEGNNYLDFEDIAGLKFINEILNYDKGKQKNVEYYPLEANKMVTYSRYLEQLNIIIGSASFLGGVNIELKIKLLRKINLRNLSKEGFLFIYKINGLNNMTNRSDLLIQRNVNTNLKDMKAVEKLMIRSNYKGNDYIIYNNEQRLIYGVFLREFRYFICVGTKLGHINKIVENERKISFKNMYSKISNLLIIMVVMAIIFFIFSFIFTRKIEKLFSTYRKRVKENEEKYALLFNHSNDGFIISEIYHSKTSIVSANKTALKISACSSSELLYTDFFSLFLNLDIKMVLKNKSIFKTVKLKNKKGEVRTIELNAIVYEYETKELVFASLRDITERILLKEEKSKQENILIQKSKMTAMGEMMGNIAHQWRQPLSQISGLFLDIESAYNFHELNKQYLTKRVDEANDLLEYMSKTIDDFRNFFNPNSPQEDFLIKEALNNALNIVKSTLKYHHIDIKINCDENLKIRGYKNEYSQAIINIISNGKDILIERKISNPKIEIYTKIEDTITLCIEDNALGIDDKIKDKIFDPYFTTKKGCSMGIGLYMTKLIIEEKMHGEISVKNSLNGAVFQIKV